MDKVIFENSGDVVVGRGNNIKNTYIKDCLKGTFWLDAGSKNFDVVEISNCDVSDLSITNASGKKVVIKNSSAYVMDLRESQIEHLILENVRVFRKMKYQDTSIKNLEAKNVSFRKDIKIWKDDSNIEITPDSWFEK